MLHRLYLGLASYSHSPWIFYTFSFFSWLKYHPGKILFCYCYTLVFQICPFGTRTIQYFRIVIRHSLVTNFYALYRKFILKFSSNCCIGKNILYLLKVRFNNPDYAFLKVPGNWTQQPVLKS